MKAILAKIQYGLWWLVHEWLYDFCWFLDHIGTFLIMDLTVEGAEHVPTEGAIMITANHLSQWDLVYIHRILPRAAYYMTKSEYFSVPILGGATRLMGAFPINRGKPDRQALQYSLDLLKNGKILVIFPEGTRSKNHQLQEGHSGAALIALQSNALIVPVALSGTETITKNLLQLRRPRLKVRVGEPYRLSRSEGQRENMEEMADVMMNRIAELLPVTYQGEYTPERLAERKTKREEVEQEQQMRRLERRATRKQSL